RSAGAGAGTHHHRTCSPESKPGDLLPKAPGPRLVLRAAAESSSAPAPGSIDRALLIRWSKKPKNHLALLHLACALTTCRGNHHGASTGIGSQPQRAVVTRPMTALCPCCERPSAQPLASTTSLRFTSLT